MGRSAQEAEEQPERQGGNQETVREAKGRGSRREEQEDMHFKWRLLRRLQGGDGI